MKVVIATGIFPPDVGGPATFVPNLVSHWRERGWTVEVVTYSDVDDDGVVRPYPVHRVSRERSLARRYWSYFRHLWRAARGASLIFAQDPVAAGFPAWLVATLTRKRFLLKVVGDFAWEHARVQHGYSGTVDDFQADPAGDRHILLMRAIEHFVARRADGVIVPSRYLAGIARIWGVEEKNIEVIYNGVEPVVLKDQPAKNPHRIVTAGRLVPWKGIDTLIGAMPKILERVPDATLVIVGDGPDEARLKERVRLFRLEGQVEFVGRLSREGVMRTVASGGVFALLSSYEGFSHQLVEAFHSGTAVVATDVGGNPELIKDGENGLMVGYGDSGATADAIIRLLEDRKLAEQFARAAAERAKDFSVERQMSSMTEYCRGARGAHVLLVSRDGSIADPESRGAGRMRLYAERVERLHVVALAKGPARRTDLALNLTVERVDVRNPLTALFKATRAVIRGQRKYGINLISAQDPQEAGLVAWKASRWTKTPFLVEEHGGIFLSPHWRRESPKNRLAYGMGLRLLGAAGAIRAVSKKIADDLGRRFPQTPVVQVPVCTETIDAASSAPGNAYGYVGRFVAQKNLPLLLSAFDQVHRDDPGARLLMVGGGPLEESLLQLAADYSLGDAVSWMPFTEDVAKAYAQIGTLVLSSDYEGWARIVVEAMSCGIPVVMTDVGCANEVMRDGVEGRIVPVGNRDALVQAMKEAADEANHAKWAAAAKIRVAGLETPAQLADRLTDFWKKCLGL